LFRNDYMCVCVYVCVCVSETCTKSCDACYEMKYVFMTLLNFPHWYLVSIQPLFEIQIAKITSVYTWALTCYVILYP